MRYLIAALLLGIFGLAACGSKQKAPSPDEAKKELEQLMVLHKEAKAKWVVQLQQMEQEDGCGRVEAIHAAAVQLKKDSDMSPEPSRDVDVVVMELAEALKKCQAR